MLELSQDKKKRRKKKNFTWKETHTHIHTDTHTHEMYFSLGLFFGASGTWAVGLNDLHSFTFKSGYPCHNSLLL